MAAGVAAHVQYKVKGMIPVNNEQAGPCCRPNNLQVKSTTLLRSQPPPSLLYNLPTFSSTRCFPFFHFFLHDKLFSLTCSLFCCPFTFHFAYFNFLSCIFSDVTRHFRFCSSASCMRFLSVSCTFNRLSLLSPSCPSVIGKVLRSPAISCLALIMN